MLLRLRGIEGCRLLLNRITDLGVDELYAELARSVKERPLTHHLCKREAGLDLFTEWQAADRKQEDCTDQLWYGCLPGDFSPTRLFCSINIKTTLPPAN